MVEAPPDFVVVTLALAVVAVLVFALAVAGLAVAALAPVPPLLWQHPLHFEC